MSYLTIVIQPIIFCITSGGSPVRCAADRPDTCGSGVVLTAADRHDERFLSPRLAGDLGSGLHIQTAAILALCYVDRHFAACDAQCHINRVRFLRPRSAPG